MTSGRALGQCPLFSLAGRLESTGRLIRIGENRRPRTYWRGSTARERPAVSSTPSPPVGYGTMVEIDHGATANSEADSRDWAVRPDPRTGVVLGFISEPRRRRHPRLS